MLAVNYETWRWDHFRLEDLEEAATVLTLVEGNYWGRYTKNADGFWHADDLDGACLGSDELEEFILDNSGPEEHVIVAPNGLMSMKESNNE